ncbi:MAG: hypothetical protein ABEJ85_02625 [Haloarculaceae archaeon]
MELDRKTVAEVALAGGSLVAFVGAVFVVSSAFRGSANETVGNGTAPTLSAQGGLAAVALVGAFVLLMGAVGLYMYRQDFD